MLAVTEGRDTPGSGGSWVRECLGQEGRLYGLPRGAWSVTNGLMW